MDDGITLHELTDADADPELLAEAYELVLRPSFSEEELPSIDVLRPGISDDQEQTVLIATDAVGAAGIAVHGRAIGSPIATLYYLAARPGERGGGIGGRLLRHLQEATSATSVQLVLGEVHDPRRYAESATEHPEARLRFYARHGALALDRPWIQPAMASHLDRVRDMLLLAVVHRPRLVDEGIPTSWLTEWAAGYYRAEEGVVPTDDEYLALVRRLSSGDHARLIPVEDVAAVELLD